MSYFPDVLYLDGSRVGLVISISWALTNPVFSFLLPCSPSLPQKLRAGGNCREFSFVLLCNRLGLHHGPCGRSVPRSFVQVTSKR